MTYPFMLFVGGLLGIFSMFGLYVHDVDLFIKIGTWTGAIVMLLLFLRSIVRGLMQLVDLITGNDSEEEEEDDPTKT